ncbi:hypothetical protein M422DRAFT_257574 [Sphaerobolus stellatus SS14]|uniref:Uncharacterized protein n=1 Tax=Sphaerobolus stellatus (strain SS14) TaxID=990650 RepID=A0A0C9VDQ9_SPHS4|nr:hypothetical protein M422DRAFT_257574 [Sphaerobolus stellatus SS14]
MLVTGSTIAYPDALYRYLSRPFLAAWRLIFWDLHIRDGALLTVKLLQLTTTPTQLAYRCSPTPTPLAYRRSPTPTPLAVPPMPLTVPPSPLAVPPLPTT